MEAVRWIVAAAVMLTALTGCKTEPADSVSSGGGGQPAASSSSAPAEEGSAPDGAASGERAEAEKDFTTLELEVTEGTLYIRTGDSFSLTRHNGKPVDYEIEDGVLSFADSRGGDIVLTLPEDESYDAVRLTVRNGHVYGENPLALQDLELSIDRGEAKLEEVSAAGRCVVQVEQGSAFLSGDLGQSVTAGCREGHLSLEVPFARDSYNYELDLSEGDIRLGDSRYSGKSHSETLDNGAERTMALNCVRGDLSVEFEK